jgi:general secretion pathway protein G
MTRSKDTWTTETSSDLSSVDQTEPGIVDVHSGSSETGSDDQPYSTW